MTKREKKADPVAAVEEPALDVGAEAAAPGDPAGIRVDTARAAAVNAYLGTGYHIGPSQLDQDWEPNADHFVEASVFAMANRDAPAQSIAIHLAMKKLGGSMNPEPVDVMLWSVFRDVLLRVLDHLKAIDDAAAAKAAEPAPAGGLPLDRALDPQRNPFDAASGFSPRA